VPFIVFFSVRTFITQTDDAKILIIFLVLGFIVPIAFSTFNIAMGRSIHAIEWRHEMPRFAGAFPGSHTLSYAMLFFTFFYCILHHMYRIRNSLNRIIIGFFLILSAYCLYKSLTRTAMVGFVLFWFIYLWGTNKRAFLVAVVASAIGLIVFFNHIHIIIFKQEDKIDFNVATSGRVELVKGNINLFLESSLTQQLVGRGLGHKARFSFHNDYIALLMQLGVIGLLLYLILIFYLLLDIFLCKEEKTIYLFGAIFISVAAMNFGSNAIIFRVEFSQYFWCIMGFFYFIKKNKTSEYETKENYPRNY
jgi:hypothetical protein